MSINKEQFSSIHYTAPGTDLALVLPKNHVWESAGAINAQDEGFWPNMPTEEVFTAPDFRRADGYVTSTKPLSYNGNIIEVDFMIGSNQMDIDGIREDGTRVPLFRNGDWAN